jgi:cyclopropane-fatty-acyl-phospholipid synthase
MVDPTLSYSCAVFEHDHATLEQAQIAKLERVCEKLDLGPDDRLLEIGTGRGALDVHAATTRGCHVTTTTISREQYDHSVSLVKGVGLADQVTVLLEDYRDLTGSYDKLVSIEMIEAVGGSITAPSSGSARSCWRPTARCCSRRSRPTIARTRSRRRRSRS